MESDHPILVTGATGTIGGVGGKLVKALLRRGLPVRAFAHRQDERADALRREGVEVVVGDLTSPDDVLRALSDVKRLYFGPSVSPSFLEAAVMVAAAARQVGSIECLVNMSQMTVSEMDLSHMTGSPDHRQHLLVEQVLDWSGLPVVHMRPTVFLQHPFFFAWAAESIASQSTLRLPFADGRTSPIDTHDVAEVVATILAEPARHIGKVYDLTGPRSENMRDMAAEYSAALGKPVTYVDVSFEEWRTKELPSHGFPPHVLEHFAVMAVLHAQNRYDRLTHAVEDLTGRPATSVKDFVARHAAAFEEPAGRARP